MNFPLSMIIIFSFGCLFGFVVHILFTSGYDGKMIVDNTDENKTSWMLEYDGDPDEIEKKKSIRFQVCVKH